jgi:hypothetical protein
MDGGTWCPPYDSIGVTTLVWESKAFCQSEMALLSEGVIVTV